MEYAAEEWSTRLDRVKAAAASGGALARAARLAPGLLYRKSTASELFGRGGFDYFIYLFFSVARSPGSSLRQLARGPHIFNTTREGAIPVIK